MNINEITWDTLEIEHSVVFLGIAPIEEHGKHMPLGVDYYLTERWIKDVAHRLEQEERRNVYTLPIIPLGNADIKGFSGNIHVSQKLIYQVVKEVLMNISSWGVKNIIVISAHADPKHLIAIEQACEHINKKKGIVAISPMGALFSNDEFGIDMNYHESLQKMLKDYSNDFHAGWIETSLMLYYDSDRVKDIYRFAKDIVIEPKEMINANTVSKKTQGEGHLGYPRLASKSLGEKLHMNMVVAIYEATMCFVKRQGYEKYRHHFLYKIPFLRVKNLRG